MKGFGKTKFESGNIGTPNFFNYKGIQFKFSNLAKGLVINNLYYDSFFNKDSSLYEISNMTNFIYEGNHHSNIYGYDTTNFKINSVKSIYIKSEFNTCHYVSQIKGNKKSNTLGGFIYVDNSKLSNSNIYFNPTLKDVGSHCYKLNQSIDTDYKSYNLPIGGVCYVNNSNTYINEIKSLDGKGSIALDGGFIYKNIDDSKIISLKGITIENYNSYHNGGAISLNRTQYVSNTYSLINLDSIHLNNCNSINGYGGGIYMNTAKANYNIIDITNCTAKKGGGGIAFVSKGDKDNTMVLNKNTINFKGNISNRGSQIYVVGSNLSMNNIDMDGTEYISQLKSNPDFNRNDGGAIYAVSSELQLKSCTFNNFGAYNNGGVIYYDSNYDSNQNYLLDIVDCEFNNKGMNFKTKCGGAIFMINNANSSKDETIRITNSSIHHYNSNIGGGIFLSNTSEKDIILDIYNSNIFNNTVKGNMINNIDKSSYDIITDPLKLEGFGGGIFMNNSTNITFKGLKAYNNSCIMKFPNDNYYKETYNSDNIYTDTLAEYNDDGYVEVKDQIKMNEWSDYFVPCGGGIFMMNGIDISEIKSSNTNIINNTPDDIFPSYVCYKENSVNSESIMKSEIYKSLQNINSDDSYIMSNTHMWSLITGSSGSSTDYSDMTDVKSYGTGGRGAIIEFNNKLDIENMSTLNFIIGKQRTMKEDDYNGCGGHGALIFYKGASQQIITSVIGTIFIQA